MPRPPSARSPKAPRYCLECGREVPLTPTIAIEVTRGGEIVGYLHWFQCRDRWEEAHPGYDYAVPKAL